MKYRPDIDGLRAIAVLAVVFFHADLIIFGGGFVGVDVFFVISGYLITTLITQEIKEGRFSLIGFYERRARRILPALFTVILVSLAIAPMALTPGRLAEFGESVVATTLFSSNILFWLQAGYFDAPAEFKPLLHTWSLAVEEQFYIVFPLALLLVARFAGGRWLTFIICVGLVSFVLSSWSAVYNPSAAFYLPQSRIWELLLGSLLALRLFPPIRSTVAREIAAVAGIALIGWGIFSFTSTTPFPGANAAFPCLGAGLLIHTGGSPGSSWVNRILSLRIPVWVGLISYSLYLWHWPAFVFARALVPRDLTGLETAAVIGFSFVAALLSWRLVEQPFRGGKAILSRPALFSGAGGFATVIVAFGVVGSAADGWQPGRFAQTVAGNNLHNDHYNYRTCLLGRNQRAQTWQAQSCFINDGAPQNALLWGDSFAAHYVPGLESNRGAWSHNILQYTAGTCAPVLGWDPLIAPNCAAFNRNAVDIIDEYDIETVILAAQWNVAFDMGLAPENISQTIQQLRDLGVKVILIGQSPVFRADVDWLVSRGKFADRAPIEFDANINRQIQRYSPNAVFIDPLPFLCDGPTCRFRTDDRAFFGDSSHLTVFGSEWFVARFVPLLTGVL
jgi:peptidoglycan/LPS O-acetylase OafA/YrhL